jgi:hypothetical protein
MITTVLVLEVLLMGTFALGWLSLLSINCEFIEPSALTWVMKQSAPWQLVSAIIAIALAYQLGSILNTVTYGILERVLGQNLKIAIFSSKENYEEALGVVYQYGSTYFLQELDSQLRFIRLARSGLVNLTMLGVGVLLGGQYMELGIISLALGILCLPAWSTIYRLRNREIYFVFKAIKNVPQGEGDTKLKDAQGAPKKGAE